MGLETRHRDREMIVDLRPDDARFLFVYSGQKKNIMLADIHELLVAPTDNGAVHTRHVNIPLNLKQMEIIEDAYRTGMVNAQKDNTVSQIEARLTRLRKRFKKASRPSLIDRIKATVTKRHI